MSTPRRRPRHCGSDIRVMQADGTGQQRLTAVPIPYGECTISPGGTGGQDGRGRYG